MSRSDTNKSRNNFSSNNSNLILTKLNRDRKFRLPSKFGIRYYSTELMGPPLRPAATKISLISKLINENGSFDILFVKSNKVKLGEAIIFSFSVNCENVDLLNELKDFFKDCGKIEIRKNSYPADQRYVVKDLKSINEKLIPLLDRCNLRRSRNLFYVY